MAEMIDFWEGGGTYDLPFLGGRATPVVNAVHSGKEVSVLWLPDLVSIEFMETPP